jgi:hypothetical protein
VRFVVFTLGPIEMSRLHWKWRQCYFERLAMTYVLQEYMVSQPRRWWSEIYTEVSIRF